MMKEKATLSFVEVEDDRIWRSSCLGVGFCVPMEGNGQRRWLLDGSSIARRGRWFVGPWKARVR